MPNSIPISTADWGRVPALIATALNCLAVARWTAARQAELESGPTIIFIANCLLLLVWGVRVILLHGFMYYARQLVSSLCNNRLGSTPLCAL